VHGRFYCGPHYFPGLEKAFLEAYRSWDGVSEPDDKFRNLFSRYAERLYPLGGMPEKLSPGRIEARAVAWKKIHDGLEFSIERHLPVRRWGGLVKTVQQEWRLGLLTKELVLLGQQDAAPRKLGMIAAPAKSGAPVNSTVRR
jgi:hypothetical protein